MYKKFISFVMAMCMAMSFAACNEVAEAPVVDTPANSVVEVVDQDKVEDANSTVGFNLETSTDEEAAQAEISTEVEAETKEEEVSTESTEEVAPVEESKEESEETTKEESKEESKETTEEESKEEVTEEKPAEESKEESKEEVTKEEEEETAKEEETAEEAPVKEEPVVQALPKAEDMTWTDVGGREMWVTQTAAIRTGPNIGYEKLDGRVYGDKVIQLEEGSGSWSRVEYDGGVAYMYTPYLSEKEPVAMVDTSSYPIVYEDETSKITIYKEWYQNAWVYAAHVEFTDYERLYTVCGNNTYGGFETTLSAANRHNAILAINGCYSAPYLGYKVVRKGVIYNDGTNWNPGVYSSKTGEFHLSWEAGRGEKGYAGVSISKLVKEGRVTDTFCFGPPGLVDGKNLCKANDTGRAQRTFIGSDGSKGDMWLCVSDGRYNDGVSAGLNGYQCMQYLKDKGCTKGINLDGGGSSTMVFQGKVLNAARGNLRAVVDHVIFE